MLTPTQALSPLSRPMADAATDHAELLQLDRSLHAQWAKLTLGLSPASTAAAWTDWLGHLAMSPGLQHALRRDALRQLIATTAGAWRSGTDGAGAAAPAADRRFASPAWQQWPFAAIAQAFQASQAWWLDAATRVPGVSPQHAQQVAFGARQWLDMLSPSNFLATNPEVQAATRESGGTNLLQGLRNQWQDIAQRWGGSAPVATPAFVPGRDVAVTPGKVVLRNELIELIQYQSQTATVYGAPVLIVPPWIMKFYILDLSPQDSLVRYLVARGHQVFIVSWKNPGATDRQLGMDDYLARGVMAAINAVSRIVPGQPMQALGYCLGGTVLAIAAAAMARDRDQRLASLTLLASQLDFSEPGELSLFIDDSQLATLDDMMASAGYLDGAQMAGAFTLLNARDLLWSRMVSAYLLGQRPAVNDLSAWNADATRMPYRQHSEYLHGLYRDNDLAQGRYQVDGQPVALADIRLPVFALGTQRDTVAPWRSVYKLHLFLRGDITFCLSSGGHNVGVVNPPGDGAGRSHQCATRCASDLYAGPDTWLADTPVQQGSWWPTWAAWLQQRAGERVAAAAPGNEAAGLPVLGDAPGDYVFTT